MKKQLLMGMVLAMVMVGQQSLAAPAIKSVHDISREMNEKIQTKGAVEILKGLNRTEILNKMIDTVGKLQGGDSSSSLLGKALRRKVITVTYREVGANKDSVVSVDIQAIAENLMMVDQVMRKNINKSDLDSAGKAHLELLQGRGMKAATKFLELAHRTSENDVNATELQKVESAALIKQIELLPKIFEMPTEDALDHIKIMESANKIKKEGPSEMNGDLAFGIAKGKNTLTEAEYRKRLEEIILCK